ncbi:MAG: hypothetical protein QG657_1604 [Acidobacteriota bacterium]|nr:hypothetical protein [Acidobacteriota bacterium]
MSTTNDDLAKTEVKATGTTGEPPVPGETEEEEARRVHTTFARNLTQMREIVDLSLTDPTLKQYANDYGYGPERIGVGKTFYDETARLYENQKTKLAEWKAAVFRFNEKRAEADKTVMRIIEIARVAFKNDPVTFEALGLKGRRKQAYGDWEVQNKYFYNKILSMPEAIAQIATYTVTQAEMEAGQQQLIEVIALHNAVKDAKAEAQHATELKDKAFRKLKKWTRKYLNVMKEALEEIPQMKEKLGIVTPEVV